MNLFGMASRGVDLDALPEDDAPRSLIDFGPSAAPAGRMAVPQEFDSLFDAAASEYGVDPTILKGIAYAESRFRPDVIDGTTKSSAGALGLMQFMPATAKEMGINPLDPAEAVFGAAAYLRQSLDKFGGDTERAIASYNWGRNRSAFDRDDWYTSLPAETRNYVGTVLEFADNVAPVAAPAGGKAVPLPEGVAPSLAGGGRGMVNPELGVNNFQEQKATRRDELAPLDEATRGVKTGITGLKQMWESNAVLKDATLAANMQERLNAFDQIDQGATNVPRAIGLAYQQAGPEERQRLRGVVQKELGNRREFLDASLATIKQYQADMQRTKGRVAEFTDIEGVKDFTNWLAFNGGSGMASMAPLIVAAVTTGPLAPVAAGVVGYGMATGELNNDRIEYAQKQGLDNRGVANYVADKRGSTLGAAIPFAGLDVVAGPVGSVVKTATKGGIKELQRMGVKQGLKEIGKDTAEEAVTGGLQEMIKLGTGYGLDETQELLTKENAKKVLNSAAAEAAGGLTGGAARVTGTAAVQQMQAPRVQDQPTTPQAPVVAAVPAEVPQAPVAAPTALAETQPASANWSDVATAQKQAQAEQAVMAKAEALPTATRPSDPASSQAVSNIEALLGPAAQPTVTPAAPAAPATEQAAPTVEQAEQQLAARETAQAAPVDMQMRSTGTLMVKGDPVALRARLAPAGVDNTIAVPGGLIVARSQAAKAQEVLSAPAQAPAAPTAAVTPQQEAANVPQGQTPPAQPAAQAASTTAPAIAAVDAGIPAAGVPAAGGAATAQADGVTGQQIDSEWTAFAPESGTRAVPRAEMPQIKAEHRGAMVNFLKARGVDAVQEEVPASNLKPTQAEFSPAKVAQAKAYTGGERSILVSSDGHVLDGHHQWLARREAGEPVKVIRLDAPIADLLPLVKEFPSSTQAEGATAPQAAPETAAPAVDPFAEKMRANMELMDQRRQLRQEIAAAPEGQRAALEARMAELETQIQSGVAEARGITRATDTQPEPAATRTAAPAESAAPRTQARTPPARPAPATAGFKRWFAGSKVVDDKGAPLVMYHGTSGNERGDAFTTIDTYASNYGLMGQGGYFTADPSVASSYTTKGKGSTPTVYPVYLSIKNPIDMDAKADPVQWQEQFPDAESFHEGGDTNESWYRAAEDSLRDQALPMWEGAEIMQDGLRAMGYDGITHVGGGRVAADGVRHRVYIAFDPEQAKSATGNNGQFDPANPDIRYSRGISPEIGAELESIKPPRRVKEVFATKESVNAALAKLVPASGRLPNGLGKIVVANAAEIRENWEPLIGPVELASESSGRVQGFYAQRTVFLIADHIRAGDEMAVAAHELMHKHGQAVLGAAGWERLHSTIERWANAPEGSTERLVYDEAVARVEASRPGDISIPEYTTQELFPYAVQIALEMGIQPSVTKPLGTVAGWLAHVRGVLSRTWAKMTEKPELFDSLDLVDMAFAIAQRENPDVGSALDDVSEAASALPEGESGAMFSRSPIESSMGQMTPDQEAAWSKAAGLKKPPTLKERAAQMKANFSTKARQGIVDQFAPIADLDQHAYMLARMSKGSDGTMEAALLYGRPFLRDGVPDVDVNEGGFARVLAGLKGEHDRFLWWVAALRAENLKAQGKENLLDTPDIDALKTLNAGTMADGSDRVMTYAEALLELNDFNNAVLQMAKDSGLIDQAAVDLFKDQPYVPFYRLADETGQMQGPRFSAGLTNQKAWKKLKGGTQQINADLLQNMLMNWSSLYGAAARNRAALATMDAAEQLAVAYQVPEGTKGAAKVMRDGITEHWLVEDPYLLEAISALNYTPSPLMKALSKPKQLLTWGVTVNPTFKIRNLIRDSVSAIAQADLSYNVPGNVWNGWKLMASDSQVYASMLASGGVIKFGTQESTNRAREQIAKLSGEVMDQAAWKKLLGQGRALYEAYQDLGDRTENVNRAALYDRLIKKGHSHAEASFMARDLMDFSMGGNWALVRFLTQTVPFLNARLQGLYKLGRAAGEDPARFAAVVGAVSIASLTLLAIYRDDEDWKKREDWDRDAYWWFKIGDKAYRIPKPFEVGALGTLAERTAELVFSKEMDNKRFMERLRHMLASTFSLDPIPQAIKPLLDVSANKDSFTGRAIETQADQKLRPKDRYGERTPEIARLLGAWGLPDPLRLVKGEWTGLSPKQVEHLLRGYFSWVATATFSVSDYAIRGVSDRGAKPDMKLKDIFIAGNFVETLPTGSSRYVTKMYEQARDAEMAYASYQAAVKAGDKEKVQEIRDKDLSKLKSRELLHEGTQALTRINAYARMVEANKTMTGEQKRKRLDELEQQRHQIAQKVIGAGSGESR